ncbi:exonuclease V [Russula compacta]|nr:exonuclease V [Russula compacta]
MGAAQNADDRGKSDPAFKTDAHSPFEEFRFRTLSVSDLVGPAWCEVQFDYGLRQGRSRPLANRPDAFVSAEGKVISVDKKVAEVNEETMERGRAVHKQLEREIHPEAVEVEIHVQEEYWAARLVNMLSCLQNLMEEGFTREMPVFGILQDKPVVGIIDEVSLKPIPEPNPQNEPSPTSVLGTPRKSKRREPSPSPSQSHVTDFLASQSGANARRSASPPRMVNELCLSDTKTRRRLNTLPSDDDALSSRMQLMLYHSLLSALLSPTFSFSVFWEKIQVNPHAQFSDAFLVQAGLARESDGRVVLEYPACLDGLENLWRSTVHSLRLRGVSPILEIVYRTNTKSKRGAASEVSRLNTSDDSAMTLHEARDFARAIAASLQEHEHDPDLERAIAESLRDMGPGEESDTTLTSGRNSVADTQSPPPQVAEQLSDMPHIPWYARSGVTDNSTQSEAMEGEWSMAGLGPSGLLPPLPQHEASRIIGRKIFTFDEVVLHAYVQEVLQWWDGERLPRGVDVEHTYRCFSCEYRKDCGWREMKANEAQQKYVERKFRQMEGAGRFEMD